MIHRHAITNATPRASHRWIQRPAEVYLSRVCIKLEWANISHAAGTSPGGGSTAPIVGHTTTRSYSCAVSNHTTNTVAGANQRISGSLQQQGLKLPVSSILSAPTRTRQAIHPSAVRQWVVKWPLYHREIAYTLRRPLPFTDTVHTVS